MKKLSIILSILIISLGIDAQVWSDDLGEIDSLHIGGDIGIVQDFFNDNNNLLYIGGPFSYVNEEEVDQLISWNGTDFTAINGISDFGSINAIIKYNNDILVGGTFPSVSGLTGTYCFAMWNGTYWQTFGGGGLTGVVRDLSIHNDSLIVCGDFEHIGETEYNKIAGYYDGNWINMGHWGQWVSSVESLNGELYGGGYYGLRKFLGDTEWEIFEDQPDNWVMDLKTDTINTFLYLGGNFGYIGDSASYSVAMWDGFKWNYTGGYCTAVVMPQAMEIYRGDLYCACLNYYDDSEYRIAITRWNGESWDSIGGAFNDNIFALEVFRDTLYIGGGFSYWGGSSPTPDKRSKGLVKLYMPDNGCHYLKPRINTWADTFYLEGGEVDVNLYNNNPYADSWEWSFGDSQTGDVKDPVHTYTQVGEYDVQVTVTDGECVKTATKTIYIELGNEIQGFENIEMQIFPNPSSHNFTVKLDMPDYNNAEIKIAGLNGHLKDIVSVAGETTIINTKGWKAGVYVCNLFVDGKLVKVEKLVFE